MKWTVLKNYEKIVERTDEYTSYVYMAMPGTVTS
ncbi:hypothetical protein Pan54_10050 [Rubinisphaera italica]|uniref:Uncharacterized protein n=1 Tax=Rubinisphaera italica TaxID=2527969 RepID=A0A5C5XD21_9PLAN|nr:hypothetical protein Pan54_10050 [Rubinisphaera italica]